MLHVDMNWPKNCFRLAFLGWIVFFFIFFCLNIGSLVFDFNAVIKCPFPNCGFIAGPYMESKHVSNVTELTYPFTRSISKPYFSYQDAVLTIATVSGSLSYLTMMFRVLLVNYSCIHKSVKSFDNEYETQYKTINRKLLNPFICSSSKEFEPVTLHAKQLFCFYTIFFLNFSLFAANVITLFVIVHKEIDENFPNWTAVNYIGLLAQLASQYCAILSCFIFSKVAYAITSSCQEMLRKFKDIYTEYDSHSSVLRRLEEEDIEFVHQCNDSMKPYRL